MQALLTTDGPKQAHELGIILPHEHLFVDLGPIAAASYVHADVEEAVALMTPYLAAVAAQGVTAFVECTPVGVGRRADIDAAIGRAAQVPVVLPTGVYREPWVPDWVHAASEDFLFEWMLRELTDSIEATGVPAAWIKVSAGDDGITDVERKILPRSRACGERDRRGHRQPHHSWTCGPRATGDRRVRGIHRRAVYMDTYASGTGCGAAPRNRRGAARGWQFDAIGSAGFTDEWFVDAVRRVLNWGFGEKLLLSQDRGWYDPSKPGGGPVQPFTYLLDTFIPKLRTAGVDAQTMEQLLRHNPFVAYSRPS